MFVLISTTVSGHKGYKVLKEATQKKCGLTGAIDINQGLSRTKMDKQVVHPSISDLKLVKHQTA